MQVEVCENSSKSVTLNYALKTERAEEEEFLIKD